MADDNGEGGSTGNEPVQPVRSTGDPEDSGTDSSGEGSDAPLRTPGDSSRSQSESDDLNAIGLCLPSEGLGESDLNDGGSPQPVVAGSESERPVAPLVAGLEGSGAVGSRDSSPGSSGRTVLGQGHHGVRCKLLHSGDIQLCRLNHTRTIVSKIMNSKYLRRWESHRLILDGAEIRSTTVRDCDACTLGFG
jgi:hypothetical protein